MAGIQWYTLSIFAIALLGSGAIGAAIQAFISAYKKRKQPIARRVDIFPTFSDPLNVTCPRTQLTLSDGKKTYTYDELQIVQIQLTNQGDLNLEEFKLGLTLSTGDVATYLEVRSPDRNHLVEQVTPLSFSEPKSEIDLMLRPLNRRDTYTLRLFILTAQTNQDPGEIKFSSPQPLQFVDLPTVTEILEDAARSASLSLGPFKISLGQ
ncbi:MAG: hypothetical protein ACM37W_27865 [Actinomycetota bacterium]